MVGTSFQGYMTYNVSSPEYYSSSPIGNGQSNYPGYSDSGCIVLEINGVCTSNGGTDTPIVLDYRVRLSGQTYRPLVVDSLYADISSRENVNDVGGLVGEAWAASRQQYQYVISGSYSSAYTQSLHQRLVGFRYQIQGDGLLDDAATNLEQGFNYNVSPPTTNRFEMLSLTSCLSRLQASSGNRVIFNMT
jgi:hypothetical protein